MVYLKKPYEVNYIDYIMKPFLTVELKIISELITEESLKYATPGAAGLDLRAAIKQAITLGPQQTLMIPTGIAIYLKKRDVAALILPRSGLGHEQGIVLGNLIGLIDADYQGELKVSLWNRSHSPYEVEPLERIAQLLIIPILHANFQVVDRFTSQEVRQQDGFGSTGRR